VLQVSHAGHDHRAVLLGPPHERGLQVGHAGRHLARRVPQVEPEVGGDLVVAAAPGAQLAAQRAEPFQQAPLQRGVHVFVFHLRPECSAADRFVQVVQCSENPGQLVVVE
jgi:hypothetical protein